MKEENKKSKKKIVLTYVILAACLLVIAAITVTLIFTVGRPNDNLIENPPANQGGNNDGDNQGGNQGGNTGNNNDDKDDDKNNDNQGGNKPTNTPAGYGMPVESASVTTKFVFAYDETLDRYCVHRGIDFEGEAGDNVCAVLDGKVTSVVSSSLIGENYITITHADGVTSTYKYIDVKEGLKVGDNVKKGDVIGTIATAAGMEMKQGEHLHFEMRVNGKLTDPDEYLDIVEK